MKWKELANDPLFNLEYFLDSQDKELFKRGQEIVKLKIENEKLYMFIYDFILRLKHIRDNGSKRYIKENLVIVIKYMNEKFIEYYKLKELKEMK